MRTSRRLVKPVASRSVADSFMKGHKLMSRLLPASQVGRSNNRGSILLSLLALATALSFQLVATQAAEPGKPAKKDSSSRIKPKQVEIAATVEPTEAKPGDVVTYTVTAKLQPGWHIYKYAKTQEGDGPRGTPSSTSSTQPDSRFKTTGPRRKTSSRKKSRPFPTWSSSSFTRTR